MLEIYYLRINDCSILSDNDLAPYVSLETFETALTYQHEKVRRTKLLGEAMIRLLLCQACGLPVQEYRIYRGEHGKPAVVNLLSPLYFNLSHSGGYVICGLSDREVGVDIEKKGVLRMEVARRFFHPSEIKRLEGSDDATRTELFFRYWSIKESFLKYTGSGLSSPLSGFEVRFEDDGIEIKKEHSRLPVHIRECLIDEDYACFVCSEVSEQPKIRKFDLF